MDFIYLIKILTTWSINNNEFELLYYLYCNFDIGIPNRYIYKFPTYSHFNSLQSLKNNNTVKVDNLFLKNLIQIFKTKSKFTQLKNWNNNYGYILL
jgi:hypothetical protein